MDLVTLGVQLLNAIQYGMVLFLVASGLTLVFGILGVINLAHGAFYMLGAYLAYWIAAYTGSFWVAVVAGVGIAFVVGLLLENVFIRRLYGRDHLAQVLLSFGLILVIDEIRQLLFGKDVHSVLPPEGLRGAIQLTDNLSYPVYRLAICAFCLVAAAIIYFVITRTRIGMIVRAGAENREMTRTLGINFDAVNRYVFAVGIALAALGGIVVAPVSTVYPGMGDSMLILSFVVVVLGGIGSIGGAAIGALLIGLTDTFGKVFFPSVSSVLIYLLMAAVLPQLHVGEGYLGAGLSDRGDRCRILQRQESLRRDHIERQCRNDRQKGDDQCRALMLRSPAVREAVAQGLARLKANGGGSSSFATRALLLADLPSVDGGEITDKGYINQRAVLSRRAADLKRLDDDGCGDWIGCPA